jgi:SNF2 family DNA or RNA helicase
MIDVKTLPLKFKDISDSLPVGYSLSNRVLDAEILIDRKKNRIEANIVGIKIIKNQRHIILPISYKHTWVIDDFVIYPLPYDVTEIFLQILKEKNPDNLSFKMAVELLNSDTCSIPISANDNFLASGTSAAEKITDKLRIKGLEATLFPYQTKGVQWMQRVLASSSGLILADEMGLGKTMQIIALLLLNPPKEIAPALIICPTSLITNWSREFEKFSPSLSIFVHRGPNRTGIYSELQSCNVVITTYETMVNDIAIFTSFEWSWLICDEAQAIKNPNSLRRQNIEKINRKKTIPMTGTPVENTLLDLWSLMDFAIPGLLGTRNEFEKKYPDSLDSARNLKQITDPMMLKRQVSDVANDLPERIDVDLPLELNEQLIQHYQDVREETIKRYPVAGNLVATLQLQLVCAHPWLRISDQNDTDGEFAELDLASNLPLLTPKMERTIDLLFEAFSNQRKVIIFAIFNKLDDLIQKAGINLPTAFWGAINGSTAASDRQGIIDQFTDYAGPACLILNPKAAGAGLNITAATIVIHYTPVWNPALESQASARAHRRGQTLPVTVYKLFYENTVERVMLDRSNWKRAMGNEVMPLAARQSEDLVRALNIQPKNL